MRIMQVIHVPEGGPENVYACERLQARADAVVLWHGEHIATELRTGEVLLLSDRGHCVHKWRLDDGSDWPDESVNTERAMDAVRKERDSQASKGWSPDHDDEHEAGELGMAAACYAFNAVEETGPAFAWDHWPFEWTSFKPKSPRTDLVKAAALLIAEIERRDRRFQKSGSH